MKSFEPKIVKFKKAVGRAPNYTPEYYMKMAKEVVDEGMSYRRAATKYKCSHGSVAHWTKLYRQGQLPKRMEREKKLANKADAVFQKQERYILQLKAEIGELYLENQLLKKAQSYFRPSKSAPLSVITSENLAQLDEDAK